jgi:glycosyltransferase involved in cell wall biosynthesis
MAARRALLISENAPVPSDRRVWAEARSLAAAGWDVSIVCAQGQDRHTEPYEMLDGIAIHRFPLRPAGGGPVAYLREYGQALWRIRRLARRLARQAPFDIVHSANPPDFLLLAVLGLKRKGTRLVFDHHDLVPELYRSRFGSGGKLYRVALMLERIGYRLADVVIVTNESYRRIAIERGGAKPENVFVVRNGPNLERFRPGTPDPAWRRGQKHLIAYLGIMGPQDGVDHAIRALAELRRRRDDWQAVLIGDGEVLDEMKALAAELGIGDRVEFAGWRFDDDIRTILSTADVCLAPDPPSPLNDVSTMIKIPEYMAIGCPIASYELTESRVSAGDAAVYAQPGDEADLARCVDELLSDPERRRAMGELGQERVRDRLAWQHSEPQLHAAYERAVALLDGDRLREVARLVDVQPAQAGDPVRQ